MKKWLVDGTVDAVEAGIVIGDEVAVRLDGRTFMARASDLFDTEAEARRVRVEREVEALEELADRHDRQRAQAEEEAKGHMADAGWNAGEADKCRARAKALRDALGEVKDATEGRR